MSPTEFWKMQPFEFWWLVANHRDSTQMGNKTLGEVREIYEATYGR